MLPDHQLAANRIDATKAKGPGRPTARQKSSQSNLRPGIVARTVLLDHLNPQTTLEFTLIENMAIGRRAKYTTFHTNPIFSHLDRPEFNTNRSPIPRKGQ